MTSRVRLVCIVLLGVLSITTASVLVAAPAQAANSNTDLAITLTNKADAKPGKKITYRIVVRNIGMHKARRVRMEFRTSAALKHIVLDLSRGHCSRSPKKIVCLFGTITVGKSASVAITGVMPKKLKKGAAVTNRATVTSATKLVRKRNDVATDNYQIGMPRVAPSTPAPAATASNKITEFNDATAKVFSLSRTAVNVTWAVLAAAILWFIIGLTLRHRSRARRGITNDDY